MEHIVSFIYKESDLSSQFFVDLTGITYPDPHYIIERTDSPYYCLEYIYEGEGTVYIDCEELHPKKGDIYILPKGSKHRYFSSSHSPWKKIWMNIYGPLCDTLFSVYGLNHTFLITDFSNGSLFEEFLMICEEKERTVNERFLRASLVFHELLLQINDHVHGVPTPKNKIAYKIKEHIDQNIEIKFSLADLSKIACLSSSQLNRVFKKEYGITPYEYILTQKIETGKLLLINTNMSIKQIAYKLNFADEHYFSNSFKERTGKTPKEFSGR